jgi:glycosyltransferase involved in cell wall biosynthesis
MSGELVSLIVATRYRTEEVKKLLNSLVGQTYQTFEVIIVDQNGDERLVSLLEAYSQRLRLRHVRSNTSGKAAANNVGLRLCEGDVIGFPDDDCWYAPDLLRRIVDSFDRHPEWDGMTGCEAPSENFVRNDRFDQVSGQVVQENIMRRHISFAVFFRKKGLTGLFYDERLGIGAGTMWGSGEETDFILRFLKRGYWIQYEPSLVVYHPDWGKGPYTLAAIAKARKYGMGMGRILQDHGFSASLTFKYMYRPLLGGVYTLLLGKPRKALYHWSIFAGRSAGWVTSLICNQASLYRRNLAPKRQVNLQ